MVSSGVVVGMDTCSNMVPSSFPMAHTILVPPASNAPINIYAPLSETVSMILF